MCKKMTYDITISRTYLLNSYFIELGIELKKAGFINQNKNN